MLFSEPKIPQSPISPSPASSAGISVLFSEPKIPQFSHSAPVASTSAAIFQCSSASRKFLNNADYAAMEQRIADFSALQRAENSSMVIVACCDALHQRISVLFSEPKIPQCYGDHTKILADKHFSALQRAENSSIYRRSEMRVRVWQFQCSSASRKFLNYVGCVPSLRTARISVLFSEPKIPQLPTLFTRDGAPINFSALQRAENSSIQHTAEHQHQHTAFQCSSASRKFLNGLCNGRVRGRDPISVLFSEPKIPQ